MAWAKNEMPESVELSALPFLYFDGQTRLTSDDKQQLTEQLESIRASSDIPSPLAVTINRQFSFDELPVESFEITDEDRKAIERFCNKDDQVLYVELKADDGEKSDNFAVILRWYDGNPRVIGIWD